jgi:acyl carrier protein
MENVRLNNKTNEINDKVIKFVSNQTGIKENKLMLDSSIFHDLGVDGEDALELLNAFSKEFNVDISTFPLLDYFGNEGTLSLIGLIKRLSSMDMREQKKKLTIDDLIDSAKQGNLK